MNDNDDDRMVDCDDPECGWSNFCVEGWLPGTCDNNIDEDEDGAIDFMDTDCRDMPPCAMGDMGGLPDLGVPDLGVPDLGVPPTDMGISMADFGF